MKAKWLSWVFAICCNAAIAQEARIALVIGAQNYTSLPPLHNSLNDAKTMTATLQAKGFRVETLYDPKSKREIKDAVSRYFELMRDKVGAVGLIFYAGHGMQYEGDNYIIPVSASLKSPADLEDDCVKMNTVMAVLKSTNKSLNILLLDACRSLPSFSRDVDQGLTRMDAPQGSIIVFAAQAGKTASDGNGQNGLFTSNLIKAINEPNINITDVFKKVKQLVYSESRELQLPSVEDNSIGGDFYFTKLESDKNIPFTIEQINDKAKGFFDSKAYYEAASWYRKSAEQGNSTGQYFLGLMYNLGWGGLTKDYTESVKWYRKSAEQGNPIAQCGLGNLYHFGNGVNQDDVESFKWFLKAANQGYANGETSVGNSYRYGVGVTKDEVEAVRWLRRAADKGYQPAQYMMGNVYEEGAGVAKDYTEAARWYQKSADQGNTAAMEALNRLKNK